MGRSYGYYWPITWKLGISVNQVTGYPQEELTHLSVAAADILERADFGKGMTAVANALGLHFIPLYSELYQLIIPNSILESNLLSPLFELVQEPEFTTAVKRLPVYDVSYMRELINQVED